MLIPRYQRRYSWDLEKAHGLVRDLLEAATSTSNLWAGVIIYRTNDVSRPEVRCPLGDDDMNHHCREVIDGQQRLTTIQLWIRALLEHSKALGSPINYSEPNIWLQVPNDSQYERVLSGEDVFDEREPLFEVYTYFKFLLWLGQDALLSPEVLPFPERRLKGESTESRWLRHIEKRELKRSSTPDCKALLTSTLSKLTFLGLDLGGDEPERIFSALNGQRTELSQFDHLRNFVFGKITGPDRDSLFDTRWQPAEEMLEALSQGQGRSVDVNKSAFLYDYLISRGAGAQERFNAKRAFQQFQAMERSGRLGVGIPTWVEKHLQDEVALWCFIRDLRLMTELPTGVSLALKLETRRSVSRLRMLSDGPPNPLLLWLLRCAFLEDSDERRMTIDEVEGLIRLFESVLLLQLLSESGITNLRSQMISGLGQLNRNALNKDGKRAAETARDFLTDLVDEIKHSDVRNRLDNGAVKPYVILKSQGSIALLDMVEEELSGGTSRGFLPNELDNGQDAFSVEHVLPQKTEKWKRDLKDWEVKERDIPQLIEHFGNLTVLPGKKNTSLSNSSFVKKCEKVKADPEMCSPKIQNWTEKRQWTASEIQSRSRDMSDSLMARWNRDFG